MQSGARQIGQWRGIPFFFHWTILLWLVWYAVRYQSVLGAGLAFVGLVTLLIAHELGHALAARSRRLEVHAIRLSALHGQCEYELPHDEVDDVFIAWGGVLAQGCILLPAWGLRQVLHWAAPGIEALLAPLFLVLIPVNLLLIAVNLVPVAPLDGHKAWRVLPLLWARWAPGCRQGAAALRNRFDFRKRRAAEQVSKRVASELFERLTKK